MRKICVFAGSNVGTSHEYEQKAEELGQLLVSNNIELIYGGSKIGLMGRVADTVLAAGGRAVGVMPRNLFRGEMVHPNLTELHEAGFMQRSNLGLVLVEAEPQELLRQMLSYTPPVQTNKWDELK